MEVKELDDDTILLIVGDGGFTIKEEIQDREPESQDYSEDMVTKQEILDVTYKPSDEAIDESDNDDLMPVNKLEQLHEDYLPLCQEWEEKTKKKKPGQKKSLVKELKQKFPELAQHKTKLITALVVIMRNVKPPPLPLDYYVMNDIMLECIICSALTETIPAAGRHYLEIHGPRYLLCYACGGGFRSRTTLYVHEKRCSAPDRDIVLRARAVMLGNKGKTRPYLGLAKALNNSPQLKALKPMNFKCDKCPAVFNSKESLQAHIYLHQGIRPFKCKECSKAYTARGVLAHHVKREHSNEQFVCDHCGRVFKVKEGLVSHLNTHLPGELRKFPCPECGLRFGQKHTMQRHVERRHRKAPPPCACHLCPARFRRTTLLKEHMRQKHGVVLMTQKMLYKALPTMTDEQVKCAVGYRV